MRTFEIILILANLAALIWSFKKPSKLVWLGIIGFNVAALLLHGVLEGFRWQMNASYVVTGLLVVYAVALALDKVPNWRIPKALKVTVASLGVVALMAASFLAYALPVFTLPKPTGKYDVGFTYMTLTDVSRTDPFLDGSRQNRQIAVKVYYPAQADDSKPYAPYFNGNKEMLEAYAGFYHVPKFTFSHFALTKTHAKADLKPSNKEQNYPVVLFSNGAGATPEVETTQSQDLASHGYVVVAIDHTYVSAATPLKDRIVRSEEATTDFKATEPADPITQIMADDDKFVMRKLAELNSGAINPMFKGKLNMDKIGVMGHSVGGAAAYNMALNDSRVKAAINLDGAVYITPKEGQAIAPFLMLANDKYHAEAIRKRENLMMKFDDTPQGYQALLDVYGSKEKYDAEYTKEQQSIIGLADVLKTSDSLYTIKGSDHMKFTDIGLFVKNAQLRNILQITGATDPARCLTITNAVTTAFFDKQLKGIDTTSPDTLRSTYPELQKVNLN